MDDDIIQEFLTESYETIDQLDQAFVELEHDPTSSDLLAQIFRSIHTIKGTAGFFAFGNLESLTHAGENLLSKLREGALLLNADMTDALLSMVDATRLMLNEVASTGSDGDNDFAELVGELHRLTNGEPGGANEATTPNASVSDDVETAEFLSSDDKVPPSAPSADAAAPSGGTSATQALAAQGIEPSALTESSIRVDVNLLDRLMNLTGELVLARNQVLQFHASAGDHTFQATAQQLDLITTEMQESVMQTRMQPIGNIWGKFPRIVRDLAAQLDKQVDLVMVGKETELDKTLVEAIKDPLTHIVRNSVDHGIESPAERVAAGKPATGRLELRSFHEGGQVIVEIADDGKGLDLAKIRATAVKRGVLTEDQANRLTDRQAAELIFNAGFSTADKVTNVSGRGVGMDVVRTNVEKIGGSIDIDTVFGQGTTLTVKIPLTLAIIPALIVTCDEDYFMIPQVSLVEVLHIAPEGNQQIEQVGDAEVFRLRGSLLPVVHLREVLGFPDEPERREIDGTDIVVLQADGQQFGLVVDQINDTEEIVVKPLAPNLKHLAPFGGTTIMGDGQVSLILDAIGIAATSGVAQDATKGPASSEATVD
ncbi:MAG: chemotaxis protein CheA, partial [Acidimicrobiales bacterium]